MRSLMQHEMALVCGGAPTISEGMTVAAGVGAGIGANVALGAGGGLSGIAATAAPAAIAVSSAAATGVAAAGYVGWTVGKIIHEQLPPRVNDAIGKGVAQGIGKVSNIIKKLHDVWSVGA